MLFSVNNFLANVLQVTNLKIRIHVFIMHDIRMLHAS